MLSSFRKCLFNDSNIELKLFYYLSCNMGKNKKVISGLKTKDASDNRQTSAANVSEKGAVCHGNKNEVIIKIHAKPSAKESAITDIGSEAVGVQIAAPPMDGEANKELIRFLAEILNVKKSEVSLDKGSRSKEKTVVISEAVMSLETVLAKLRAASKQ